jgi:hypothetical protein
MHFVMKIFQRRGKRQGCSDFSEFGGLGMEAMCCDTLEFVGGRQPNQGSKQSLWRKQNLWMFAKFKLAAHNTMFR